MADEWKGEERRAGWSDNPNQLLTEEQMAGLLQIKPNTLAKGRLGKGGVQLPFVKVGKSIRYRQSAYEDYVDSNTFDNTAQAHHARNKPH